MVEVVFCVGIAASGKTTWAYKQEGYVVLDSDAVREELYGDATCQDNPDKVFNLIYKRAKDALRENKSVIFCSTNLTMKYRIHAIRQMKSVRSDIIFRAVVFNTPLEICKKQNKMRERQVPDWLFMKQMKTLELPVYNEGYADIEVIDNGSHEDFTKVFNEILKTVCDFGSQKNEHHSLTLFEHCANAYSYACDNNFNPYICGAALAHDFGKAWTQEYWKKDDGKNAHYPNHANVGAYLSLNLLNSLHCAQLVNYHMLHYTDEKCQATWHARLGEDMWHELELLHEADLAAH